jgi:hypothetical protein
LITPSIQQPSFKAFAASGPGNYYGAETDLLWRLESISPEKETYSLTFLLSTGFGAQVFYAGTFEGISTYIKGFTLTNWPLSEAVNFEEEVYRALDSDSSDGCHHVRNYFFAMHGLDILDFYSFGYPDQWFDGAIPDPLLDITVVVRDRFTDNLVLQDLGVNLPIIDSFYFQIYRLTPTCRNYQKETPYVLVERNTLPPIYSVDLIDWSYPETQFVKWGATPIDCVRGFFFSNFQLDWTTFFKAELENTHIASFTNLEFVVVQNQYCIKTSIHALTWSTPLQTLEARIPQILDISPRGDVRISGIDLFSARKELAQKKLALVQGILNREDIDIQLKLTPNEGISYAF